ncbi:MAG: phytanoyl-CoA dioxygenase family protein [Actinomycetota bacterium]|nr:phytanoyl-CoA dioxygenase family protein [Actinomycetota bacterium]
MVVVPEAENRNQLPSLENGTGGAFALSCNELQLFNSRGYIGPFDVIDQESLQKLRSTFDKILSGRLRSPIYGRTTHRDWHLYYRNLMSMVYRPEVIERVKSLLGENLLVWRTSIFHKGPADGGLDWHQSSLFAGEEYGLFKPALMPPEDYELYSDLFNVSVWIALDDVTTDNGAMQIAVGTHTRQYPVRKVPLMDSVFGKVFKNNLDRTGDSDRWEELSKRYACDTIFDPDAEGAKIDTILMRAGQAIIFTDRVLHGSLPNVTPDQRRLAINFRVTIPEVEVYPHRRHGDMVDGNDHNIEKHACVMLTGSDAHGKNVYLN